MVTTPRLRVVFFGTPAFAVPTLDALLGSRHHVVAAVTQPDRPRGRGQKTTDAPVKARAAAAHVPVLQPDRLKDPLFADAFAALGADLGVVAAYGRILPESLIATPRLGLINVHASLLPAYRGAAPVHRAVVAGERHTGVTIMRIVKALDAGPMLAAAGRPIGPDETSEDVERGLATIGAALLVTVADAIAEGHVTETPQDDRLATYAPRLTREDGLVEWTEPAGRIRDLVRGLYPWPHAFTYAGGHRVILLRAQIAEGETAAHPGTVIEASGGRLHVATGRGLLAITELQPEGKRALDVRAFLAGHRLSAGTRFTREP